MGSGFIRVLRKDHGRSAGIRTRDLRHARADVSARPDPAAGTDRGLARHVSGRLRRENSSIRSAVIGSIRDAFRAGTYPATSAAPSRIITASASVAGRCGFMPYRNEATNRDVASATASPRTARWPPARHFRRTICTTPPRCAQRHPDADLAGAAGDVVRDGAVETDAGDHQRQDREGAAQPGKRDLLVDRPVDVRDLRSHLGHRHARVRLAHHFAHGVDVQERVARRAQRVHHLIRQRVALVIRHVHHGRDLPRQAAIARVSGHSDNLHVARAASPGPARRRIRCCPSGF